MTEFSQCVRSTPAVSSTSRELRAMAVAAPAPGEATPFMVDRVCPRRGHTCSSSPLLLLAPPAWLPRCAAAHATRRCYMPHPPLRCLRMRSTGRATSTGPVRPAPASPRLATPPPASRARPRYPQPRLSADRGTPSHTRPRGAWPRPSAMARSWSGRPRPCTAAPRRPLPCPAALKKERRPEKKKQSACFYFFFHSTS